MFQSRAFASEKKECRFFLFFFAVLILEIIAEFFFLYIPWDIMRLYTTVGS